MHACQKICVSYKSSKHMDRCMDTRTISIQEVNSEEEAEKKHMADWEKMAMELDKAYPAVSPDTVVFRFRACMRSFVRYSCTCNSSSDMRRYVADMTEPIKSKHRTCICLPANAWNCNGRGLQPSSVMCEGHTNLQRLHVMEKKAPSR